MLYVEEGTESSLPYAQPESMYSRWKKRKEHKHTVYSTKTSQSTVAAYNQTHKQTLKDTRTNRQEIQTMKDTMKALQKEFRNLKDTIHQAITESAKAVKEILTDTIKNLAPFLQTSLNISLLSQ